MPDSLDILLATMPGMQAEFAAKALTAEGITCLLDCGGLTELRHPAQEPAGPFAVTLPVSIYVTAADAEEAARILASLAGENVIGDQWQAEAEARAPSVEDEEAAAAAPVAAEPLRAEAAPRDLFAPRTEGTTLRLVLLLLLAGLALFVIL